MSDFFKAMEESRNARIAGFTKSIIAFTLPDPINYVFHFGRLSAAEQTKFDSDKLKAEAEEIPPIAFYIAHRAKKANGQDEFDGFEEKINAAKQLALLPQAVLDNLTTEIFKQVDKIEDNLFGKMVGNSEKTDTATTSAT